MKMIGFKDDSQHYYKIVEETSEGYSCRDKEDWNIFVRKDWYNGLKPIYSELQRHDRVQLTTEMLQVFAIGTPVAQTLYKEHVEKGYLHVCKAYHGVGAVTICTDTAKEYGVALEVLPDHIELLQKFTGVSCKDCGSYIYKEPDSIGTGYVTYIDEYIDEFGTPSTLSYYVCYDCVGHRDKKHLLNMKIGDRTTLYLTMKDNKYYIQNWPATLEIAVMYHKYGSHNLAGSRTDVWFKVEENYYHGTQYGDNTQLCYIQRVKKW